MRRLALSLIGLLALLPLASAQTSAAKPMLAATPPMGWNSWNWFAGKVTQDDVKQAADLVVSTGMRDAGYVYINIDDTWQGKRDASGVLHPNEKFPDMKGLADYVHSKGLKLGIYSSPGDLTCAKFEGSLGHEQQDADLYASWGIDYLKYDLCGFRTKLDAEAPGDKLKQNVMMRDAYVKMHQALLKTGRPIVYSLCQYGFDSVWQWGPEVGGNLWRTTGDVRDNFPSIALIAETNVGLGKYAGPGHWNDPDMLEVGNGKLTMDENRTHMGMWAMLAAPLLAGNNLTKLTPEVTGVLTNREVVAIDQDSLGKQAERVYQEGPVQIWSRPLADGGRALAVINFGEDTTFLRGIPLHLKEAGVTSGMKARDVWAAKDLGAIKDDYKVALKRHEMLLLRFSK
ncbi:alpha-galactosidase [Terriglobus roseus DSM 18391]|uniref:Alpha-galactosidase n=1 Tax=Terriglobus roseus (strain DSM 18391 / NRRL B-41598 / KBS 63) TaxID=926566 RepID=I3ZMN2_TERRK|nr:glycoside hydrolase family 27 protein [Terriglobus roseus]AFL90500.1 alpha-galactosidase [Terriglobus roseus DSM 18391]